MFNAVDQQLLEALSRNRSPQLHNLSVVARSVLALDAELFELRRTLARWNEAAEAVNTEIRALAARLA